MRERTLWFPTQIADEMAGNEAALGLGWWSGGVE
jgi:hypothetical protein